MDTLTSGELQSMESALAAYRGFMARTEDAANRTSKFSIGELLNDTSSRAWAIVQEQRDNYARFVARRGELVELQPPDHELVLSFVESVRRQAESPLPSLMDSERNSNSGTAIIGGSLLDTAAGAAGAFKLALPVVALVALAYLVSAWRK